MQTRTTITVGGQAVKVRADKAYAVVTFRSHWVPVEDRLSGQLPGQGYIPFAHAVMATDNANSAKAKARQERRHAGPGVRVVAIEVATGTLLGTR